MDEIRKQVNKARRLRIRVLSDSNKAEAVLRCQPGVLQIYLTEIPVKTAKAEISSIDLEVEFTGDDTASADLLETLLEQKVRVASFSEMTTDLEEVFLRLTKGEVA